MDTGGSMLAGFSTVWDHVADTIPDTVVEHNATTLTEISGTLADGSWYYHLRTCDNAGNCSTTMHSGPFEIDTGIPTNALTLSSTSHTVGASNVTDNTLDMTWSSDASDGSGSGIAGVSVVWDQVIDTIPDTTVEYAGTVHAATSSGLPNGSWYFHLRSCDLAGNCSDTQHVGPYTLNLPSANLCGTISTNTTWGGNGELYKVTCSVTINNGVAVTVMPGTTFKFSSTSYLLTVNGILNVQGNASLPVSFTSFKDDSVGGDSNGDGTITSPAAGDWSGIVVGDTGNLTLDYASIRFGGYNSTNQANVYLSNNAQVLIENTTIARSKFNGIRVNTTTSGKTTG